MQSLEVSGYSAEAVRSALHSPHREVSFRYQLLDMENNSQGYLSRMEQAGVDHNSLASIKRTAKFRLAESELSDIDYLNDRIQPWLRLRMPDGSWAEWPQGIFLLSSPNREITPTVTTRAIEAYDQTVILKDDKVADRYTVASGTNVIDAVRTILEGVGITRFSLVGTTESLPEARDWDPGTEKLAIINDLLDSIGYRSLYFSASGSAVAQPYERPDTRPIGYTYATDRESLTSPEATHELDLFGVPNEWVIGVSEPERTPLRAYYLNDNPDSPTSTVNRGRTITDFRQEQEATSQAALDAKVERLAFEASQVYEAVDFSTALMPHHEDSELIELDYWRVGKKARYVEHTWSMQLKAGTLMKHRIRRVVAI